MTIFSESKRQALLLFAGAALGIGAAGTVSAADTVRYGIAGLSANHAPALLGEAQPEVFAKHDIDIEITDLRGNSANCIAALLSEAIDVCQVGSPTGVDAIVEGAPLKAVAVTAGPVSELVLSKQTADRLGIAANAPVDDRIAALKGLRIVSAAPGSAHYITLDRMLREAGLTISDVQYRTLGDVAAMMESIRNDQIDGAMWGIGGLGGVLADGSGVRWISLAGGDVPELKAVPYVTVYARTAWIDENTSVVKRLHASLADAIAMIKSDPDAISPVIKAKYFETLDANLWHDGFQQAAGSFLDGAKVTRAGWELLLELQAESTGKDYGSAGYEAVILEIARTE
ncbi:ABC transporter substrate-binding protein [Aquamicrobium sp. LC103]|uniref:ABC transporter substrate-binding protein n=1 Tax=Aquamicrobium sp. LC103 TaxID=1120658 RepID=UPI00063EB441|nr:ABC transporter substrate-binding protein [Aquamicrobium sp. LC103]TKT74473.1 ABC transporter substrate-binding protein [Aquamicrobium sp. LC103]